MKKHAHKIQWGDRAWFPVRWGFCSSEQAWDRFMAAKQVKPPLPYPTTAGCCTKVAAPLGDYILVTVDDVERKGSDRALCFLVHEAVHVKQSIVRAMGEENVGDEFEAYAVQHISAFLIDAYRKTRGRAP